MVDKYPKLVITIRNRDLIEKLSKIKSDNQLKSWSDVIEYLLTVISDCQNSSVTVKTTKNDSHIDSQSHSLTVSKNVIDSQNDSHGDSQNKKLTAKSDSQSNSMTVKSSVSDSQMTVNDDYLDNNDFQEMMDAIKTAINRGERNKVLNILRYFLGDKLLTTDQYEKLIKQYEWIKEMLIFNGRGYKVQ